MNIEQLLQTPRMGHAAFEPHNSVGGLYEMIKTLFKPEFRIAEIGSFQGVSTMLFALNVSEVYSIDCYDYVVPESGRIPSHDQLFVDAEKLFLERTKDFKNIIKIRETSLDAAKKFEDKTLDAVYIDAEHDYNSVKSDVTAWKDKIKHGGVLCGHDFYLPHIRIILEEQDLCNDLITWPDSSWSVIIK